MTAMPADIFGPIFRKLLAQAWEQGRCAAARGQKNNPYTEGGDNGVHDNPQAD